MNAIPSSPAPEPTALRVRTAVKAGGTEDQHSEARPLHARARRN